MKRWEVEATMDDGHPINEIRVFDVLADFESTAIMAAYAAAEGADVPVKSVVVRVIRDGEMSRSEIMRDAIENGFKMLTTAEDEYK